MVGRGARKGLDCPSLLQMCSLSGLHADFSLSMAGRGGLA